MSTCIYKWLHKSKAPGQQDGWREKDKEDGSLKTEDPALGKSIWQRLRGEVPLLWTSRSTRGTTPHTPHQLHTASHKRTALQYPQKNYLCRERTDIQRSRPTLIMQVVIVDFLQGLNFNPYRLLPVCLQYIISIVGGKYCPKYYMQLILCPIWK